MLHATVGARLSVDKQYVTTTERDAIEKELVTFSVSPTLSVSESRVFVLSGVHGSGKSALISRCVSIIRSELPKGSLILEHHVQAEADAFRPSLLCRRLASLIATRQNNKHVTSATTVEQHESSSEEDWIQLFQQLLNQASTIFEQCVIILDDAEDFSTTNNSNSEDDDVDDTCMDGDDRSSHRRWIEAWISNYDTLPANVRIVLTTSDSQLPGLLSLHHRAMPILTEDDCRSMGTRMLLSSSTAPPPPPLSPPAASPLVPAPPLMLNEDEQQLLQAMIDARSSEPQTTTPRTLRRTVSVVRTIGTDVLDEGLLVRMMGATTSFEVFEIVRDVWPIDSTDKADDSRLEKLIMAEVVFAAAVLIACAAVKSEGLSSLEYVRVLRYMLKTSEVGMSKVRINSKAALHLMRALGFQNKVGGVVGGPHADVQRTSVRDIETQILEDYGMELFERLKCWRGHLSERERVYRHGGNDPWSTTRLDVHACIAHCISSRTSEPSLSRCKLACYHMVAGESWHQLSNTLIEIRFFDMLWCAGYRSQERLVKMWCHIILFAKEHLDTFKSACQLDPVTCYHKTFTLMYDIEQSSVDPMSDADDQSIGASLYNLADFFISMGLSESKLDLPDFVMPHIPHQHFDEWHQLPASRPQSRRARIEIQRNDSHSRKGGYKLYRRFIWSWFPLLAWYAPSENNKLTATTTTTGGAGGGTVDNPLGTLDNSGVVAGPSMIEVMEGISRAPLSMLNSQRVKKTEAQLKATARAESRRVDKTLMSPRTRKTTRRRVALSVCVPNSLLGRSHRVFPLRLYSCAGGEASVA